jgi:dihydrodipicolinate synthase/N-acetylneuraminate lyase
VIRGTLAAAVTPLTAGGSGVDEDAVVSLVDFLAHGGVDGVLALGTAGEGMLLDVPERKRVAGAFIEAAAGKLDVAVHAGAQSTAATVELAAHAAEVGAAAVAVIAPPYFPLGAAEQLAHLEAAAAACAPTSFYVYEFAQRSGYAIELTVLHQLRERAPNFKGLKVSDAPFDRFAPYLLDGLDVFVGPEGLIAQGLAAGAVGAVSALATAFPEIVAAAVQERTAAASARAAAFRATVQAYPMPAALKAVALRRGAALREDVRPPLRMLTESERSDLFRALDRLQEDDSVVAVAE